MSISKFYLLIYLFLYSFMFIMFHVVSVVYTINKIRKSCFYRFVRFWKWVTFRRETSRIPDDRFVVFVRAYVVKKKKGRAQTKKQKPTLPSTSPTDTIFGLGRRDSVGCTGVNRLPRETRPRPPDHNRNHHHSSGPGERQVRPNNRYYYYCEYAAILPRYTHQARRRTTNAVRWRYTYLYIRGVCVCVCVRAARRPFQWTRRRRRSFVVTATLPFRVWFGFRLFVRPFAKYTHRSIRYERAEKMNAVGQPRFTRIVVVVVSGWVSRLYRRVSINVRDCCPRRKRENEIHLRRCEKRIRVV